MARRIDDLEGGDAVDPSTEASRSKQSSRFPAVPAREDRSVVSASAPFSGAGFIRMHNTPSVRLGLAAMIAAPILGAVFLSLVAFSYILHGRIAERRFSDVDEKAYLAGRMIATFGRTLLIWRNRFQAEHPEYDVAQEWPLRGHWLVTGGFIDVERFADIVGAEPDATVSVASLERAAETAVLLGAPEMRRDGPEGFADGDMVAAYVLDLEERPVAADHDFGSGSLRESAGLRRLSSWSRESSLAHDGNWISGTALDRMNGLAAAPLVRLTTPILRNSTDGEWLGTAVVVFGTDRILSVQRNFRIVVFALILCLLAFVGAVCWYAVRRVTAPLRRLAADMHALADGDLSRRSSLAGSDEIGLVAQSFNSMAERLRLARLNEKEASRLESDLFVARQIQNNLLPSQTPQIRGFDIFASYRPAKEIGGDYYDFLPIDSRHMGIIIADVSGKSIPAALVMSSTRAMLRFVAPGAASASETLSRVNAILSVDIPRGMFVTACYIILDPLDNSMIVASAGHTPLLVARGDDSVELVNPGGIALGFDQGPIFQRSIREQKVVLSAGDRVLAYTDGVVECANSQNEQYSDRRLREFLRRNRGLSSRDFVGALVADLDRHRGAADVSDDTTIVTFGML